MVIDGIPTSGQYWLAPSKEDAHTTSETAAR